MPLLPREPELYPEGLFGEDAPALLGERTWWVLHTRPRQEKSLSRFLCEREIPFYLPLAERRWRLRGRPVTSHLPLFAGYLFLLGGREERLEALSSRRVVRSLEVADQERLWHDLRQVHRLVASGMPLTPEDRLVPGALVEIRSGPLAGLRGKVLRAASGRRFVIQVDFIQRGASVTLDDVDLAAVNER